MNALRQVPNLSVLRLDWNSSKFDEQFEDISIEDAGPDSVEYHDRTHLLQLMEILSTFRQLEVVSIDTLKALVIDRSALSNLIFLFQASSQELLPVMHALPRSNEIPAYEWPRR